MKRLLALAILTLILVSGCDSSEPQTLSAVTRRESAQAASKQPSSTPVSQKEDAVSGLPRSTTIVDGPISYNTEELPLIGALPNEDIWLYDRKNGEVVLSVGGQSQTFSWGSMLPRFFYPKLAYFDSDKDGKDEIICAYYTCSGTAFSVYTLHILQGNEDGMWEDHKLTSDQCWHFIHEALRYEIDVPTQTFTGDLGNQQFVFCSELLSDNSMLIYGEIIDYDLEDPILIRAGLGVCPQDSPGFSHYFGELISEVKFSNGQYTLSNFQYKELDPVQ